VERDVVDRGHAGLHARRPRRLVAELRARPRCPRRGTRRRSLS
jgi:hypothetical protein